MTRPALSLLEQYLLSLRKLSRAELQKQFDSLPFTWYDRVFCYVVPTTPAERRSTIWSGAKREDPHLESKYGIGHFAERKRLLDEVLARHKKADLHAVYAALHRAWSRGKPNKIILRYQENFRDLLIIRRNLGRWLKQLRPLAARWEFAGDIKRIDALAESHIMIFPTPPQLRGTKAGRNSQPWLKQAHAELRTAGITNLGDRRYLLMAIGLLPYRD
jgi:hypothetical protein